MRLNARMRRLEQTIRVDRGCPACRLRRGRIVVVESKLEQRDDAAFEALVRRHGPMVQGVCRRILGNIHDADDAFQAAFLVLVRKANSVVPRELVANWLHGVARQTAVKARAMSVRRHRREQPSAQLPDAAESPGESDRDWQALLDEELSRLPEKYRVPIVLCDLEGKTRKDAARQLGWPEGTVSGRLSRARSLLAVRLRRRGVTLSATALAATLTADNASASLSLTLAASTVKAAGLFAAGQSSLQSVASAVAEGVLKTMLLTKLKSLSVGFIAVAFVLALGSAVGHRLIADDKTAGDAKAGNLRDTLLVLDQQFWQAVSKHDVETLGHLMAGDYFGLGTDDTRYTKASLLESYRQFRSTDLKVTSEREVVRIDERTAILTYNATFKVFRKNGQLAGGRPTHRRLLFCWVQRDGGWFIKFSKDSEVNQRPEQVGLNETNFDLFQTYPQFNITNVPSQLLNPSFQSNNLPLQSSNSAFQSNLPLQFMNPRFQSLNQYQSMISTILQPNNLAVGTPWQSQLLQSNSSFTTTLMNPTLNTFTYNPITFPPALGVDPALGQLINKVLKAHGGENALQGLKAFTMKVKETDASGHVSTITHFVQLPDHYRVEISRQGENGTEIHILGRDGMKHWRKGADGKTEAIHYFGFEPTREYWLDFLRYFGPREVLRLKEPGHQLKRLDEIDVHFRPAVGIQLTVASQKAVTGTERKLYFDKETGLLVKELRDHVELLYGTHKTANGITLAQKWSEKKSKDQEPTAGSVQEFKILDKHDSAFFQNP
jgi:RNA polymerase sigma factor (sigma-70 family)